MDFIEFLWECPVLMLLAIIISVMTFFMGKLPFNKLKKIERKVVATILIFCAIAIVMAGIGGLIHTTEVFDGIEDVEEEILEAEEDRKNYQTYYWYRTINDLDTSGYRYEDYMLDEINELKAERVRAWIMGIFVPIIAVLETILGFCAFLNSWMIIFRDEVFDICGAKKRKRLVWTDAESVEEAGV